MQLPAAVLRAVLGMGLFLAGAWVLGQVAGQSRLYHGWIWAGTAPVVWLVSAAAASWAGALTPWWLPDAYVVEYPTPVQLENYDVAIVVMMGGMVALALSPLLAAAALVRHRLQAGRRGGE